jgi:peptidoglycan-associated lipoprotein
MTSFRTLLVAFALVSACKKQPVVETAAEPVAVAAPTNNSSAQVNALRENFNRVYFDTDSSDLTEDSKAALTANSAILVRHTDLSIEIQGHADERGTTDYNLALGQRRAEAIRTYIIAQGVAPRRVKVISYGEERPLDPAKGEIAWSKNRRAEFRILSDGTEVTGTTE